jgi:hypothetical protein
MRSVIALRGNSRAQLSIVVLLPSGAAAGPDGASSIDALIFTGGIGENASDPGLGAHASRDPEPVIDSSGPGENGRSNGRIFRQACYAWSFPQTKSS